MNGAIRRRPLKCLALGSLLIAAACIPLSEDSPDPSVDAGKSGADGATADASVKDGNGGGSGDSGSSSDAAVGDASSHADSGLGDSGSRDGGSSADASNGDGANGYPLKNSAVPSDGCGKALSMIKSGTNTYKMTSAGLDREYIVSVPSNYDQSKPYRLVFGMHWMGGSDNAVNSDDWYQLKPLDTEDTTIWVAPQGYTDGAPWRGGDNKDHLFFEDLAKLVESNLCIDTSRVFAVGFSFGAMYTNALAQTHQDILRGVVVYATADYNIYFPPNTGKPLAYMGVHGTSDNTCPFSSGRESKDRFVKNNGCTVPANVPEATSNTHVAYDYQCPSNYPVRWDTHNGGHTDRPMDPGQSRSWAIDPTWQFITQF